MLYFQVSFHLELNACNLYRSIQLNEQQLGRSRWTEIDVYWCTVCMNSNRIYYIYTYTPIGKVKLL